MAHDAEFSDIGPAKSRPSFARWFILAGLLAAFTALNYLAVSSGSPSEVRQRAVLRATLATITGPFVGPIARQGQTCCLHAALTIAFVLGPILAIGLIAQVVPLPFRRGRQAFRLTLWTVGWFAWLFGCIVSLSHALF